MRSIWNRLIGYCGLTVMAVCLILTGSCITADAAHVTYGNIRGLFSDYWEIEPYQDLIEHEERYDTEKECVFVFGDMSYYREHVIGGGIPIASPLVSYLDAFQPLEDIVNHNNSEADSYAWTTFNLMFDVYCVDVVGTSPELMRAEGTAHVFNGQYNVLCTDEVKALYEQFLSWLDLTEEDFDALAVYVNADGDLCGYQCLYKDDIDTQDVVESDVVQKELAAQIENMTGEKLNYNPAGVVLKVSGKQSYDAAFSALEELNKMRVEDGLAPLVMDAELLEAAMLRAAETVVSNGKGKDNPGINYRPTGETCLTASDKIDAEYCYIAFNENVNYRFLESLDMRNYPDSYKSKTAFDSEYTIAGVGCIENNGSWYWIIELGTGEAEPVSKSGIVTKTYEIVAQRNKNEFLFESLEGTPEDTLTAHGQRKQIQVFYALAGMTLDEAGKNYTQVFGLIDADSWTWESTNESVATVDAKGVVTAVGEGYTMLWGWNPANSAPDVRVGFEVYVDYSAVSEEDDEEDTGDSEEGESGGVGEVTIYGSLADTEFTSYYTRDVYLGHEEVTEMVYDMTHFDVDKTGILVFGDVVNDSMMQEAIGNMWWLSHAGFAYALKPAFVSGNEVKMFAFDNAGNSEKAVWDKLVSLDSHKYNNADTVRVGGYTDSVKALEGKLRQMLGIAEDWSGTLIVYVDSERQVYGYMADDTDIYRMADWLIADGVTVQYYDELTWQTVNVTEKKLYSQAEKLLEEMNYQRSIRGLYPYVVDEELTELAMRRAVESLIHMDHNHYRLNGMTALGMSLRIEGEIVAQGTGAEAVDMWLGSTSGHREAVLDENYVSVGIGVVQGVSVVLFNTGQPEKAYQAGKPDAVETYSYYAIPAFQVCVGNTNKNTADMTLIPNTKAGIELWMKDAYVHGSTPIHQTKKVTVDNDSFLWSSSNPAVATVDKDGIITAKQLGQAEITGVNIGDKRRTVTVRLTVAKSVPTPPSEQPSATVPPTVIPNPTAPPASNRDGWIMEAGQAFWYEDGVKQGTEGRGKEIYDIASDAWYWLDADQNGAIAKNKDVYQESLAGAWGDVLGEDGLNYGKWVRYDSEGHMVKGWQATDVGIYYFDRIYGTMAKGYATIDGQEYYFDEGTGILVSALGIVPEIGWKTVDGKDYWYENYVRQGYHVSDAFRGKEIYDQASDAWYWLDNVQGGAKAVSKDVYQESLADDAGNIGKWVRYDAEGHMIKGWSTNENGTCYFDKTYGTMLKGTHIIDGVEYYFDEATGIKQ